MMRFNDDEVRVIAGRVFFMKIVLCSFNGENFPCEGCDSNA